MYQKGLSLFIALLAITFIGAGITGFYSLEDPSGFCDENKDCQYSVCCPLASESYGVCAQDFECKEVLELSGVASAPVFGAPQTNEEVVEKASQSYVAIALGVILLLLISVVSYVEWQDKPKQKKRKRK